VSPSAFRIGLLGRGTVGAAFEQMLPQQAARIETITGLRPSISGVLTRTSGVFEAIL
jgi:homoserine dehydrogenase